KYAVLALGDSAYVNFCETGRRIDARLEELGATRIADRVDLDLDFAEQAATWTSSTLAGMSPADDSLDSRGVHADCRQQVANDVSRQAAFTPDAPLEAEITGLVNLNGTGSTRETWHVEFATDAAGYVYKPGDAIGIIPENDPQLVEALLSVSRVNADSSLV